MKTIFAGSPGELKKAAKIILESFPLRRVFAFSGEMGAGKTTLIKVLCSLLGVSENVTSPTFALVNEYLSRSGEPVYHFDFYRIESEKEAEDMGAEEYFESGHYCFIEWPEKILHLVPEDAVKIVLEVKDETRQITMNHG